MSRRLTALLLAACLACSACRPREPRVRIRTDMGTIELRLFDHTPRHRDNFLKLAREGFYDSLLIHRVVRDFMIQSGDPDSRNAAPRALLGAGGPGYDIPAEIRSPALRGALAAARWPDHRNPARLSNGSQFFIVQGRPLTDSLLDVCEQRLRTRIPPADRAAYLARGGAPELHGQYTVFGEVVAGLEVLDKIAAVPRDANDRPLHDLRTRVFVE